MHYPLISNNFLEGYEDLIVEQGANPLALFQRAKLDPALLRWPDTLIPFDRHNQLLMLAAEALECPHFGLELARRQGLSIFGPLVSMINSQATVGAALDIFINHISVLVQTVELELLHRGDLIHFIIRGTFEKVSKTTTFQDHALALAYDLVRIFCGRQWLPRAAYFPHSAPKNVQPYANFFHCPLGFDHKELALVIDASLLEKTIDSEASLLPKKLRRYLEQRHHDDLLKQVKHVVALTLPTDECKLEAVAHTIGYSKRTLQRRLGELDTSFQEIVDSVRYAQAQHYLDHPYYRLTDIAAMLGYSELSAFSRSFKRWFGISPQAWKQKHKSSCDELSNSL